MELAREPATTELALLKPRQSLQNIGDKKDDEDADQPGFQAFGPDGFTFLDFLDIVNPLQHIPIVATLYRDLTGDEIDPGSRIAGATLFGGPIGAIVATANVALSETTGKDMGDHIVAFLNGEDEPAAAVTAANAPQEKGGAIQVATLGPLSPMTANLEVLEWAQREAALVAGTPAPATAKVPEIRPKDDLRSQAIETKELPGAAYDIATNVEVRDWAQSETRRATAPWQLQEQRDQAQVRDRERISVRDTTRQKAVASGLTQEQLAGAAAPSGGWFSETMLMALASYQDSAGLGKAARAPVDIGATDQNMSE